MRRLLTALSVLVTFILVAAPSAFAGPLFGFNDNSVGFGQLTAPVDAGLAAQAGANVSRVQFDWRYAEASQGLWNLGQYDAIYNADLAKGIRPVFIVAFAPKWAWADPNQCLVALSSCRYPPGPSHLDAWRNVVTKLVTRYPQLAGIEVWNEPNLDSFWKGGIDPSYYAQLVIQAHSAVRAAGSAVPVIAGALSNYMGTTTASSMNYRTFLQGMYAAGVKGNMEALSIHPYPGDVDLWRVFKTLTETRDVRDANSDSVPLWVTEIGVSTVGTGANSFSENDQAVLLEKYYNELTPMKDVGAVFLHTLVDPSIFAPADSESGFGSMHVDLSPKPAYCKIAALRQTSYVCPSTVAAVTDLTTQRLRWNAQDYVQAAADAARSWYKAHGTYLGLTTAALHALNPALSVTASDGVALPGASADPSRVGVWAWGTAGAENLLLCNTSQADRSYCIETQPGNPWVYGSVVGSVNSAAGAITNGTTASW